MKSPYKNHMAQFLVRGKGPFLNLTNAIDFFYTELDIDESRSVTPNDKYNLVSNFLIDRIAMQNAIIWPAITFITVPSVFYSHHKKVTVVANIAENDNKSDV